MICTTNYIAPEANCNNDIPLDITKKNLLEEPFNGDISHNSQPRTCVNPQWETVEAVTRAKEGVRGAWFFSSPTSGTVVVKHQSVPEHQVRGTILLDLMGLSPPRVKLVHPLSDEGKTIGALAEHSGLDVTSGDNYLVMDCVYGKSFSSLDSGQESILTIQNTLRKIGELAVYDLLIGNFDRFHLESTGFNGGNFMFEVGNGNLKPIDTDCEDSEGRLGFRKLALKKITLNKQHGLDTKLRLKLEEHLGAGVGFGTFPEEIIRSGMQKAIEKIVKISYNLNSFEYNYINNCKNSGLLEVNLPSHVKECIDTVVENYSI